MINFFKERIIRIIFLKIAKRQSRSASCIFQIITVTTRNEKHFVIYTEISRANSKKSDFPGEHVNGLTNAFNEKTCRLHVE